MSSESEPTTPPAAVEESDVVFLLSQIGYVVSHSNTGDAVVKSAQQNLKTHLNPELKTPEILESVDLILKYAAAAQVPATFLPSPFNIEDYMDLPIEEPPPPVEETSAPVPDESEAAPTEPAPIEPAAEPL